jgi:alkanesulfonate monooxygenase SsuD/methylene tetrahydromethanopterin reductase-like flavin-dependent oxidoreductase (luciferase family)
VSLTKKDRFASTGACHLWEKSGKVRSREPLRAEYPDLEAHVDFCRRAEACGIDSVLTAFGFHRADPIVLASALGMLTTKIKFMIAVRSGICSPTVLVQQVNTLSALTNGRICLNVVGGHTPNEQKGYGDFLSHDDRYARTDGFLTVCRAFWEGDGPVNFKGNCYHIENGRLNTPFVAADRTGPEIFLGGSSAQAFGLAARHANCLWSATYALADKEWLNPWLWTGAVRTHGAPGVALVGSFEEVASALIDYAEVGVTQFILSGWPKLDEMILFGNEIQPRVRKAERRRKKTANDPP